jgi:hypothetical protein
MVWGFVIDGSAAFRHRPAAKRFIGASARQLNYCMLITNTPITNDVST